MLGEGWGAHAVSADRSRHAGRDSLLIPTSVKNELSSLKPAARAFFRENSTESKCVLSIYKRAQKNQILSKMSLIVSPRPTVVCHPLQGMYPFSDTLILMHDLLLCMALQKCRCMNASGCR